MVRRTGPLPLCFLDTVACGRAAVRGAALVTDARTVPIELRVTDPLAPTRVQSAAYGAALEEHAAVDLLAVPLLRALREDVSVVLVRAPRLLRLQERVAEPVVRLGRQEDLVPIDGAEEPGFLLSARDERFPSVVALGPRGRHEETRGA